MDKVTSAEFLEMISKRSAPSKQKYKNKWVVVDGIKYHSKKEAAQDGEYRMRILAGEIISYERQKRYPLKVNDILICTYVADFVLQIPGGGFQVVDVKSYFTRRLPEYRKKKKLMKAIYGITIIEV